MQIRKEASIAQVFWELRFTPVGFLGTVFAGFYTMIPFLSPDWSTRSLCDLQTVLVYLHESIYSRACSRTRPDTRPPVADGWAGADMRVFGLFDSCSPTDRRTDGRTDKASYRVACPQLKREMNETKERRKEIKKERKIERNNERKKRKKLALDLVQRSVTVLGLTQSSFYPPSAHGFLASLLFSCGHATL